VLRELVTADVEPYSPEILQADDVEQIVVRIAPECHVGWDVCCRDVGEFFTGR
jgi:hypothetical protein